VHPHPEVQILQKDIEPGTPLAEDVGNIVQAAERCRKIIQTMLSLVRKADEERRQLPVTECVQSALDLLGSEAKRLQVRVRLEVSGGDSLVSANANRLLQVFFHLLQHSLLALGERRVRGAFEAYLTVSVIPGFGNVEVRIEDNGDGVKHEYEIQSSVAFTVSKMILEEHEAGFFFTKAEGRNQQRIVFQTAEG
jgi:two-component system NtrC family sensor kinase